MKSHRICISVTRTHILPGRTYAIRVTAQPTPWPQRRRFAGVSSFGMGGANAHVVLEEAPATKQAANAVDRPYHLLTLSAKNQLALQTYVRRYVDYFAAHPELDLGQLCYTACQGRSHFAYRLCIAADSVKEIQAQLAAHINDDRRPAFRPVSPTASSARRLFFHRSGGAIPGDGE